MKARTARVFHDCEGCSPLGGSADPKPIAPGHRYLLHTSFPDGYMDTSDAPWSIKECVSCAAGRDDFALHEAGACATYCHGVTPCALPLRHDGDHECRQCVEERHLAEVAR